MAAYTVYISNITYEDTAGTFAGNFLHNSKYEAGTTDHKAEVLARLLKMFPDAGGNIDFEYATVSLTPAEYTNV